MVPRRAKQGGRPRAEMTRKTEGVAMTRRVRKAVKSGAGAGTQLLSPTRRENEETGQPLALVSQCRPRAGLQVQGRSASASQSWKWGRQVTQAPLEVG